MTDLELLPGGRSGTAMGVNDEGLAVGVSDTGDQTRHAVLWREGRITDLGTLGGWHSEACDVNRHGVVVGWSETESRALHPFIWRDGRMTDLGTLGGTRAVAAAINDRGWVVGSSSTAARAFHAFVWKAGEMVDLGAAARGVFQFSLAHDVDDRGRIVGEATVDGMNTVPVMWEDGRIRRLANRYGRATAINSADQVAGCLSTGPECFVWSRDQLTVIGSVQGSMHVQAEGIDRQGRVVGSTDYKAFIWENGRFQWLPGLTTGNSSARAISDQGGFIVGGSSTTAEGLTPHPMVWDPALATAGVD
jgi:probable HAF family extracellular repeat protein